MNSLPQRFSSRTRRRTRNRMQSINATTGDAVLRSAHDPEMLKKPEALQTRCIVAGGGPAGMMLGLLLARAGIDVIVLEKHADFNRDFRGDTIHPSTLQFMHELGYLDDFLKLPHRKLTEFRMQFGDGQVIYADLAHVPLFCKFLAMMPQWEFLSFLAERARRYETFQLFMNTTVTGLIYENDVVTGVRAERAGEQLEFRAGLVVGADGRNSTIRQQTDLPVVDLGGSHDVLWMRLPRHASDRAMVLAKIDYGHMMIMLDRGDYWQCAYTIPSRTFDQVRLDGIEALRTNIAQLAPFVSDRVEQLRDWDDIKVLSVTINRLETWCRPGLLFIGDAAHAMSPAGGVGVNMAIQDAVAAANVLYAAFERGKPTMHHLQAVQRRRKRPTALIQRIQRIVHVGVDHCLAQPPVKFKPPLLMRIFGMFPILRRIPGHLIGVGLWTEHIRTPDIRATNTRPADANSASISGEITPFADDSHSVRHEVP